MQRFIDVAPRRWQRMLHGVPVHAARTPPERRNGFVLVAAGSPGARADIETWLQRGGLQPWDDYLAVA